MSETIRLQAAILGAMVFSLVGGAVQGADTVNNPESAYQLNPYVVTAQRTETRDLDTPAATTTITQQEIKNTGAKTVFDAISFAAGITNFSYGPAGLDYGAMDSRVNIRGLERGALILVNGAPINLNNKNSINGIMLDNVDRIEIVRGAASTLYGADALSGVVNIITKAPDNSGGTAVFGIGNSGYKKYMVGVSGEWLNVAISKEYLPGQSRTSPNRKDLDGRRGYEYYNDRSKGDALSLAVNGKINDAWSFNYMRSEVNSTYGQMSTEANESRRLLHSSQYKYNDVKNNASLIYDENGTRGMFFYNDRFLYGQTRNLRTMQYNSNSSNYTARKYGIDVQHTWKVRGGKDSFIGGILASRDTYQGTSTANSGVQAGRNSYALYGSYSYEISPSWTTILGGRYEKINDPVKDQNVFMPQWQLIHKINEHSSLYTNIGKAFTMPNLSDTFKLVSGRYQSVSGRNLKPEEGWNYEIGYKRVTARDSWRISLFHMDFKNFFDWAPNAEDGGRLTLRVNGGKFKNTGIEGEYKRFFTERLTGVFGVSYSNPQNQSAIDGGWEQTYPRLQFTSGIEYSDGKWQTGASLNWLTDRLKNRDGGTNPDLINLNAHVGYTFNDRSSIRLDLNNILDRHNVITNGAWEYWDLPFTYTISYMQRF